MLSCCDPRLPVEAQITLMLKLLCGFSVSEIAHALLETKAAAEKRLGRAKKFLMRSRTLLEARGARFEAEHAGAVRQALYLLFNEGYHGTHPERVVREELCAEAIRLGMLLAELPDPGQPETWALLGLMSLHAARLPARLDDEGCLLLLEAQDRALWDRRLIAQGLEFLSRSASGPDLTRYHIEAALAAKHSMAESFERTDWPGILELYDLLLARDPSPVVALNRAIALAEVAGPKAGLEALAHIPERERLASYPFLPAAEGKLLYRAGRLMEARAAYERALRLGRNPAEQRFFARRVEECRSP